MIKIIPLLVLLIFTSGCAFVGYGGVGEAVYTSPEQSGPVFAYTMLKKDLSITHKRTTDTKPFELSDIESEWGTPDKTIIVNEKTKRITYKQGFRWKGIVIIPLIPIPIAIPVGHKTITFNFENDSLKNWTVHDDHYCVSYAGFNLIPFDPEGKTLGLAAESSCKWHKDMTPYQGKMACHVLFYDRCYLSPEYGRGEKLE
jgi:hypothetical protein